MQLTDVQDELDMFFAGGTEALCRLRMAAGKAPIKNDAEAVRLASDFLREKRLTQADYLAILDGDRSPLERLLAQPIPEPQKD